MSRFHPSMAWNQSYQPQKKGPVDSNGDLPSGTGAGQWDAAGSIPPAGSGSVGHGFGIASAGTSSSSVISAASQAFLLPLHYEPSYRYPLIVWLHNDGFNENQIQHVMPHISLRNFVAVGVRGIRAADSVGHRFDWSGSTAAAAGAHEAVVGAIEAAGQRFSVDPSRIVLAGYRSGGSMALRIALREPQRFAGVVSLGGRFPAAGGVFSDLALLRRRQLPMLWQWATRGAEFDRERLRGDIRAAMLMQAKLEIRQYDDDDEMNTVTLADINRWIIGRVVGGRESTDSSHSTIPTQFSNN